MFYLDASTNMAHQLRKPVRAIAEIDELRNNEERYILGYEYLEEIYAARKTIEVMTDDLEDLSKLTRGKMYLEQGAYSLAEVIHETYMLSCFAAKKRSIELHLDVDETLPRVLRGDGKRMKQVLLNLLTNAIEYTPIGIVEYRISYQKEEANRIRLRVTIEDTGIGMKPTEVDLSAEGTQEEQRIRERATQGLELGLTVAKRLLQEMGSSLEIESEYGQGSIFQFNLVQEVVSYAEIGKKETWESFLASPQQQIATDVINIQESIHKEMTEESVIANLNAVKKAMIDFNIEKAIAILKKIEESSIPETYQKNVKATIESMNQEEYERVAFYLDKMLED